MDHRVSSFIENLNIRPMVKEDLADVLQIELSSYITPWGRQHFLDELANPDLSSPLVVEAGKKIIAYAVLWFILDECHLANIAVSPDYRRMGVARYLMRQIIRMARERHSSRIMLEVRKSNKEAIALYESLHFVKTGVRRNYYHDGFVKTEDAILMDLDLNAIQDELV